MERRLSAILAADVVGYSRLMGLDEAGTLAALKTHRREMADARIAEHQGRIVKLTGDGMLVEFPSVVNAVACAADISNVKTVLVDGRVVKEDVRLKADLARPRQLVEDRTDLAPPPPQSPPRPAAT